MVSLLLALKQVLQGHHFLVMQDKKVALLWRLSCRNNTQECERTSYVPRTSGRYILEETTNVIYVQSKARHTFNNSPLEVVIMLEQTLKTNWAVHYVLVEREFLQENMLTKIKILMLLRMHSVFNSFQYC